jgi:hypothetical protein
MAGASAGDTVSGAHEGERLLTSGVSLCCRRDQLLATAAPLRTRPLRSLELAGKKRQRRGDCIHLVAVYAGLLRDALITEALVLVVFRKR